MFFTRPLRNQIQSLAHLVDHYAKYPPTGLTMKRIVDFGTNFIEIFLLKNKKKNSIQFNSIVHLVFSS